jgi:hypothetical protein
MAHPLPEDKRAAFVGLIAGLVAIIATVVVISQITARSFASHSPVPHAAPAAGQPAPVPH